jgi:hypothetical protein
VAQPWLMLSLGASSFLLGLDAFAIAAQLAIGRAWLRAAPPGAVA